MSGGSDTLLADGGGHAGGAGTRSIGVEVLVHFIDDLVLWIGQSLEVIVHLCPGPGTAVGVALYKNVLASSTGRSDAVDGGLVEVEDESL